MAKDLAMGKSMEEGADQGRRLSYKYRIYPNAEQREYFAVNFGCVRYVYNHFLAEREASWLRTQETIKAPKLDECGSQDANFYRTPE